MRLIKLSTEEFPLEADFEKYLTEDLPTRDPPWVFVFPKGRIADGELVPGEIVLFSYRNTLRAIAEAGTGREDNVNEQPEKYAHCFTIKKDSLHRTNVPLQELERRLRDVFGPQISLQGQGWTKISDNARQIIELIADSPETVRETAAIAQPIEGDKLYQERAREALPLLVRQAHAARPITYSDLADELRMPNARNLNYVLGSIGKTIERLSVDWNEKIPPIQCLVVNKATGFPGEGIGWFITTTNEEFRKLPRKHQRLLVEAELRNIFAYARWNDVLAALHLRPVESDNSSLINDVAVFQAGGESENHKRLKHYVAAHPEVVGLPSSVPKGRVEYSLPSGDSLDVLFKVQGDWTAVEVKSSMSNTLDITRGLFQCVKYLAVIEAVQATQGLPQSGRAVLVLEGALPRELIAIRNTLGVEVIEGVIPISG